MSNTHQSCSCLYLQRVPVEILCEIFSALLSSYHELEPVGYRLGVKEGPLASITVSHVCRVWRTAAIATPTLWQRISLPKLSDKLVDLYLRRSKEATLTVGIHQKRSKRAPSAQSLVKIFDCMARIGEVRLAVSEKLFSKFTPYFERPAPRLKILDIHIGSDHSVAMPLPVIQNIVKSPLRTLQLHRVALPWNSSIFRGLSTLTIAYPSPTPTVNKLLQVLESVPNLLHFTYHEKRTNPMGGPLPLRGISLMRLMSLRLMMIYADYVSLIDNIDTPALVSWNLDLFYESLPGIPPMLSRNLQSDKQNHSLAIDFALSGLSISTRDPSIDHPLNGTTLDLIWRNRNHPVNPIQIAATNINSHFPVLVIEVTLTIKFATQDSPLDWAALLASLPNMRTLSLVLYHNPSVTAGWTAVESFVMALTMTTGNCSSHFHCLEFSCLNLQVNAREEEWDKIAQTLHTCLALRTRHHLPKIGLHLKNCRNFRAKHARVLEPVVKSFTWDDQSEDPHPPGPNE